VEVGVLKLKLKYAVLVSVISLAVLTLCLRGAVPEKTYTYSEIPASAVHASIVSYDPWAGVGWGVDDFSVDIGNWWKYEQNITSLLSVNDGVLNLTGVFDYSQGNQFVVLFRNLDINVSELPVFSINVSVSEGAIYHVRFVGKDSNGVERDVWWETSPLDDLSGKSRWETHVVDLAAFSEQAVGSPVSTLTRVMVILDSSFSKNGKGEESLCISHVGFSGRSPRVSRIPGDAQFVSSENPFQAVIIDLPYAYRSNASWSVKWSSVTYTLTSSSEFEYVMVLLSRDGDLLQEAQGVVFLSHENELVDIYRLDATPKVTPRYAELTLLQPLLGPSSIVIMKKDFGSSGFQMFKLDSIELMTTNENPQSGIDPEQVSYMAIGMVVAVIAVPILLLAIAFRFKEYFSKFPSVFLAVLFAYGIACRLVLAPFTGHPYDMEVWTQATRLFYESGIMNIRIFPLPFNCYLLLLSYSPYALLRTVGFQDIGFLAHNFNMLEAVFIKMPFILSDLFSFYFLFKILNRIGGKLDLSGKLYAFVYFLSPLAIVLSSVWGMYDGIAVALFLAGTYYSLFERKPFRGAAFYALSGLTKAFGFIGLIPIAFTLLREKRYVQLLAMFGMVSVIVVLLYLPLLAATGLQAAPELFMQFIRGRVGLGSVSSYVASTSYMSYLSLLGFDVTSPYLTYLLIALVLFISVCFGLKSRGAKGETYVRLTLGYFAVVIFVFYLLFFRLYEQYYLWIIPVLIIYSYVKKESGFALAALGLSVVVLPVWSFSIFFTGTEYIWIHLNLPADTAIMAILPSAIVALSLVGIASKGPLAILKTWEGMLFSAGVALWFSFGLAYYAYYGFPPLGVFWYLASFIIILATAVFLFKKFRSKEPAAASVGS
jgi:hypothetical protein